ncbi:MAG: nucleoside deaminase [Chloroherpetonaceae bacterium]|nr:nucleoside deaminase [Chloroherpetonaceae bacterium]
MIDHSWEKFMRQALREAEKASEKGETPVGAIILDSNGFPVGKGYNQVEMLLDATAHAEMIALTAAMNTMQSKYLQDCTLVVTMEPCPMCAGALVLSKIGRIVFGAYDSKMGACGTIFNITDSAKTNHRIESIGGILEGECKTALQNFFITKRMKN